MRKGKKERKKETINAVRTRKKESNKVRKELRIEVKKETDNKDKNLRKNE